ncbi:hypothetical protein ACSC9U_05050 [Pseudomonas solani]|uniref:hypothetical protein n=1 Tax=Pseudomonas solani TaxID=2731552 RepID=UPI003F4AF399
MPESDVQRDEENRQIKRQTFIKNVNHTPISLIFPNNSFRRHFLLTAKKGTATTKMDNRATKRIMISGPGRGSFTSTEDKEKIKLWRKRYTDGSDSNTVINLEIIDFDTALTTIATAAVNAHIGIGTSRDVTIQFQKACVCTVNAAITATPSVTLTHQPEQQSIKITIKRTTATAFELGHTVAV